MKHEVLAKTIISMTTQYLLGNVTEEMFLINMKLFTEHIENENNKVKNTQ